jgi:3-hydroxyisobutyrate dehydrogenase
MCRRLLENQVSVAVWNRTRARAEPLAADGATVTGSITELAELGADLVFITVTGSDGVLEVVAGPRGLLAAAPVPPAPAHAARLRLVPERRP